MAVDQRHILGIEPQHCRFGIVGEHPGGDRDAAIEQVCVDARFADHLADQLRDGLSEMSGQPVAIDAAIVVDRAVRSSINARSRAALAATWAIAAATPSS